MAPPLDSDGFCRELSQQLGEGIVATAAERTYAWLAIEIRDPWGANAFEDANLPKGVQFELKRFASLPGTRLQFIRKEGREDGPVALFIGYTAPGSEALVRIDLPEYRDVVTVDTPAVLDALQCGVPPHRGDAVETPVVLVCTNGKRDRCCAKFGLALYRALAEHDSIDVWQTTHVGGHRFAPTLLTLRHGLCYGRVEEDELDDFVQATKAGRLHRLDRFRGRTCYARPIQAAIHFARQRTGSLEIGSVEVTQQFAEDELHHVNLTVAGERWRIVLQRETGSTLAPPSCGKAPEPIKAWREIEATRISD